MSRGGDALRRWAHMNGDLILYAFLPALLFGDAMAINMHVFKGAFWQCMWLATVGVLASAYVTGYVAYLSMPYDHPPSLYLTMGAVLASTDPVAIVALLNSVGASTVLTVQITGESLFNDGVSMVLFKLFFDTYRGKHTGSLPKFLVQQFLVGPLIGILCGGVTVFWLSLATRRFSHEHATIQLVVTICCAYISYALAELADSSGVLGTVSAGLVVAWRGWPLVVEPEALESVWEFLEHAGNTLLFALVGVITRRAAFGSKYIQPRDYLYAFVLYLIVELARLAMIVASFPILSNIGYGCSKADAAFMWRAGRAAGRLRR